jgi:hypothetical protein
MTRRQVHTVVHRVGAWGTFHHRRKMSLLTTVTRRSATAGTKCWKMRRTHRVQRVDAVRAHSASRANELRWP